MGHATMMIMGSEKQLSDLTKPFGREEVLRRFKDGDKNIEGELTHPGEEFNGSALADLFDRLFLFGFKYPSFEAFLSSRDFIYLKDGPEGKGYYQIFRMNYIDYFEKASEDFPGTDLLELSTGYSGYSARKDEIEIDDTERKASDSCYFMYGGYGRTAKDFFDKLRSSPKNTKVTIYDIHS